MIGMTTGERTEIMRQQCTVAYLTFGFRVNDRIAKCVRQKGRREHDNKGGGHDNTGKQRRHRIPASDVQNISSYALGTLSGSLHI